MMRRRVKGTFRMWSLSCGLAVSMLGASTIPAWGAVFFPEQGPTVFSFANREQISVTGSISSFGVNESNWGIAAIREVRDGTVTDPGATIEENLAASPQFTSGPSGQITGMFYGLQLENFNAATNTLESKGGFLDLYWDEPGLATGGTIVDLSTLLPASRTALDQFTGITDGTFLVRIAFASGINPANANTTVSGSSAGFPTSITGVSSAESYGNVALGAVNHQGTTGLWETILDTDFFMNAPGGIALAFGSRDIRLRNTFSNLPSWSGTAPDGTPILGASSSDPATVVVPEPATLALFGLALVVLGFGAHYRRKIV